MEVHWGQRITLQLPQNVLHFLGLDGRGGGCRGWSGKDYAPDMAMIGEGVVEGQTCPYPEGVSPHYMLFRVIVCSTVLSRLSRRVQRPPALAALKCVLPHGGQHLDVVRLEIQLARQALRF